MATPHKGSADNCTLTLTLALLLALTLTLLLAPTLWPPVSDLFGNDEMGKGGFHAKAQSRKDFASLRRRCDSA